MTVQPFVERVEAFMALWGYTDDEFGRRAMGDGDLMKNLRLTPDNEITIEIRGELIEFMRGGASKHAKARRDKRPLPAPPPTFLQRIETFVKTWGYTESEFGRRAMGDPNFITELRKTDKGRRSPTLRTIERVDHFMLGGALKHSRQVRERNPIQKKASADAGTTSAAA